MVWPGTAGVVVCRPVRRTGGLAPSEGIKRNQGGSALLTLDAELVFYETAFGLEAGVASHGEIPAGACSLRVCVSRRIDKFFCAKGPVALSAWANTWLRLGK